MTFNRVLYTLAVATFLGLLVWAACTAARAGELRFGYDQQTGGRQLSGVPMVPHPHDLAQPILWGLLTGVVIGVPWIALSSRDQGGYRPTGWLAVVTLGGEAGFFLLAFVLFLVGWIFWGPR